MQLRAILGAALGAALLLSSVALGQPAAEPDPFKQQLNLCAAIDAGDAKAVATALDLGAKLEWDCPEQKTAPILHAVEGGNVAVITVLLDRGANANQEDNGVGATPLHYAAVKKDPALVALLVKRGGNVNVLTTDGLSPLALAVWESDDIALVQAFIDAGADVNEVNEQGDSIFDIALAQGHKQVAALLESKGAKRGEEPGLPVPAEEPISTTNMHDEASAGGQSTGKPPEGELVFKGLYLGMSVVEAARVMLKNNLSPGDTLKWSDKYSLAIVRTEYNKAAVEHEKVQLVAKFQKYGVSKPSALAKQVLSPEAYAEAERKGNLDSIDHYDPDDNVQFRQMWFLLTGVQLFTEEERFMPFEEYLAIHYPAGVPHALGGLWKGEEPLRFEAAPRGGRMVRRNFQDSYWEMHVDDSNQVQKYILGAGTNALLFGAGDLTPIEFVQAFINAYGIPGMEPVPVKRGELDAYFAKSLVQMGWEYVDRQHGWGVRIDEDRTLTVVRLTRASDTKFD